MNPFLLAAKGLKRNVFRSVVTVLLFAFALGAIAYGFSYPFFGLEDRYLDYLDQNGIKAVYVQEKTAGLLTPETLKEILPDHQSFYEIKENYDHFGDTAKTHKSDTIVNMTDESELEEYGFKMEVGTLPQKEGDLALSLSVYKELQQTGILVSDIGLNESGGLDNYYSFKKFISFEEAKKIFVERNKYYEIFKGIPNYNLTGIVDTGAYYETTEADLKKQLGNKVSEKETRAIESRLDEIEKGGTAWLNFQVYHNYKAVKGNRYLTKIPTDRIEQKTIFSKLRDFEEQNQLNSMLNKKGLEFAVIAEPEYKTMFYRAIVSAYALFLILLPIGSVFLIVAFIMMIGLEATRLKASRDEIATMRSLGMRSGKVYSISLIRSLIMGIFSFAVSVGFAFLLQSVFQNTEANKKTFELLNVPIFLITLAGTAVISILSSLFAYRRFMKKTPAEIFRQNRS